MPPLSPAPIRRRIAGFNPNLVRPGSLRRALCWARLMWRCRNAACAACASCYWQGLAGCRVLGRAPIRVRLQARAEAAHPSAVLGPISRFADGVLDHVIEKPGGANKMAIAPQWAHKER
jgi:hypothetical protein